MNSLIGVREEPACQIADDGATRLARGGHDAARYPRRGRTVERRQLKAPQDFGVFCLFGENFVTPFSTLAMIKGSLPTKSTAPDRLRWCARPSDVDFTRFFEGEKRIKKVFFRAHHLVVIYTPKEAHSRIFVTGGSVIVTNAGHFFFSWRGELVTPKFNLRICKR